MQRKFPNRVVLTKYIERLCFVQAVDMRCSKTACNHDKRLKNIMKGQSSFFIFRPIRRQGVWVGASIFAGQSAIKCIYKLL